MPLKMNVNTNMPGASEHGGLHVEKLPVLCAWATGELIRFPFVDENPSEKDQRMRSLAVMRISDEAIYAPCDGTVSLIDAAHNMIQIRNESGLTVGIKVCKSCISLEKEADILVKAGQNVTAGQELCRFDGKLHAKSKLLLIAPADTWIVKNLMHPLMEPGEVVKGTPVIGRQQ